MKIKWRCNACGDTENCEIPCELEVQLLRDEPTCCPYNGEEAEWSLNEPQKPTRRSTKAFSANDYKLGTPPENPTFPQAEELREEGGE